MTQRYLTIAEMGKIQDTLNEHTVTEWRKHLNVNDFKTAMFDEFAELLNSGSWKWWKNSGQPVDYWNLKIEAIDILHFALSKYICENTIDRLADFVLGFYNTTNPYMINNDRIDRNVFINKACALLTSDNPVVLDDFFDSLGMQDEEISAIYTAKSELNFIRQDEGYKDGKYIKYVDGIEDNARLESVVIAFISDPTMSLDGLRKLVKESFYYEKEKETQKVQTQ